MQVSPSLSTYQSTSKVCDLLAAAPCVLAALCLARVCVLQARPCICAHRLRSVCIVRAVAMKLMYGNLVGSLTTQSGLVIRLLHHMSAKQGVAMDSPASAKKIAVRIVLCWIV